MLKIEDRKSIIQNLEELIFKCEGAMMAAKNGSYLHNFAYMIQEELRHLMFGIENGDRAGNE